MKKTIIVSNRLPVKLTEEHGEFSFVQSEGGLATGLGSVHRDSDNVWVGWPGMEVHSKEWQQKLVARLGEDRFLPVFLSQDEINNYYEGFSNETLWPVFHYMPTYAHYRQEYWDAYVAVNKKFCDAVLEVVEPGDTIWIHDYQLLLLPGMIRAVLPDASIGFFQHIPFPSYELYRLIPWRVELLEGMLGADLIGFHTFDDARHFVQSSRRLIPSSLCTANEIMVNQRTVVVDTFPMGIDSERFNQLVSTAEVQQHIASLRKTFDKTRVILSIDRLDYSKGILQRLQAFELLLQEHPHYLGKILLYMIVVPSRDTVPQYRELRDEIDMIVGGINARYRTIDWQPIYYFYRSFPVEELSALYACADIGLVTPMRDGMNLVCKEYVASRQDDSGVLILSEMAGASKELVDALIVNPNDIRAIAAAIVEALDMSADEQARRMAMMKAIVSKFNIHHWVRLFMTALKEVKQMQVSMYAKRISANTRQDIRRLYRYSNRRLIFLDYDGTLVGFKANIDQARPDEELYDLLQTLCADPYNRVVIVSGRDPRFLDQWFDRLDVDIISEHGAWTRMRGQDWECVPGLDAQWKKDFWPVLEAFTDRTPGSFIEEKSYSLVWHYRKVEESLGELRSGELMSTLRYLVEDRSLQLLPGNKVVEVKNVEINKGKAVMQYLQEGYFDFIMAIGDDHTDEDIFKALPQDAVTIKVGSHVSAARYYIGDYLEVRTFLRELAQAGKEGGAPAIASSKADSAG